MQTLAELAFGGDLVAVPRAREVVRRIADTGPADIDDVELVVAELVTNAVLHGAPPATVIVRAGADRIRVEVADAGRHLPVTSPRRGEAMTGRGLELVAAVAAAWGVDRRPGGGKVVWAELTAAGAQQAPVGLSAEDILDAWGDDDDQRFTVRIPPMPTALLVEAKSHVDNLVREYTLARADGQGTAGDIPESVKRLIDTVTNGFADARAEIKRQALAAAQRGDAEVELVLQLPASAADAAEDYLDALEQTDAHARAARILTLAAPPLHRVLRRWYLGAISQQIRAQVRGEPIPPARSLLDVLADEVTFLSSLRDTSTRLRLLQRVTGELTGALGVEEMAATVAANAMTYLGAVAVRIFILDEKDRTLKVAAAHGGAPELAERYREFPLDSDLPAAVVARTGRPMVLRNRAEIEARFPPLAGTNPMERALHIVPLRVGAQPLGCLTLTFPEGSRMEEADQASIVTALADILAQALQRALAMRRAEEANERLAFLADASVALSSSLDYRETAEAVARLMVPRLADWCVVVTLDGNHLVPAAVTHSDPSKVSWAKAMAARFPTRMDAEVGAANVVRTGRSELYPDIPSELAERVAADAEHLAVIRQVGMASGLVVPLTGRAGTFGAITLIYAESGRRYSEEDLGFVEDVARRSALALETAHAFHRQAVRLANVTNVAEAAQHAILAPPSARIGPVALSARYVSAAAEAQVGGDLYEVVRHSDGVRLLIGDVRGKGLTAVRTATVVLGEFRAAAADVEDITQVAVQLDRRVRPYLGPEDFVTALIAQIDHDGVFSVASCGHPPAFLVAGDRIEELDAEPGLPLGLGADPRPLSGRLRPGDRLLLYTDGMIEARGLDGRFIDVTSLVAAAAHAEFHDALDGLLASLRQAVGEELGDDLALLLAEYVDQGDAGRGPT